MLRLVIVSTVKDLCMLCECCIIQIVRKQIRDILFSFDPLHFQFSRFFQFVYVCKSK